jgi:3-hydroxy-3-methylglutaryl CoA synthase
MRSDVPKSGCESYKHCYLKKYGKSIKIVYYILSHAPNTRILLSGMSKILKETGECERYTTDQTLENLHGLQAYRS